MVPVAMLLTFFTGLVGLISVTLALPLAFLANLSLTYILEVARFFADLPFAAFVVPTFPFWVVPIAYLALVYLGYRLMRNEGSKSVGADLKGWTVEEEK